MRRLAPLFAGVLCVCSTLSAQAQVPAVQPGSVAVPSSSKETMLEPGHILELVTGDTFAVRVPLHLTKAANVGSAELRITLAPDGPHAQPDEHVVLIARLGVAQAFLVEGDQMLVLRGVVPAAATKRRGAWHAVDYSIHLGSGGMNIGTPDDQLIDTKALTETLTALHLTLTAHANE